MRDENEDVYKPASRVRNPAGYVTNTGPREIFVLTLNDRERY